MENQTFVARTASLTLMLLASAAPASAQTTAVWNGGDGSFNDGANWSNGTVPAGVIDNALIDGGNSVSSEVQINGGDHLAIGSLTIDANDSLILSESSSLEILTESATNPDSGRIHNAGQIRLNSSTSARLRFDRVLNLSGGGTVVMNEGSSISASPPAPGQFINHDNTIRGTGRIGSLASQLTNEIGGVIHANVNAKSLSLIPSELGIVNRGTLRASNGGVVEIRNSQKTPFDNTGGLIEAIDGGRIFSGNELDVFGGTLRAEPGTELNMGFDTSLTDMTFEGNLTFGTNPLRISNLTTLGNVQIDSSDISIGGTIENPGALTIDSGDVRLSNLTSHGSISVESTQATLAGQIDNRGVLHLTNGRGRLEIEGEVEIKGGGTIRLSGPDSPFAFGVRVVGDGNDPHLINSGGSTINGVAEIGDQQLAITNRIGSVIDANVAPRDDQRPDLESLKLFPNQDGMVNRGILRASNGGFLFLEGKIDNTSGVIEAIDGGRVGNDSWDTEIFGGTVRTRTGGEFRFGTREASISDAVIDIAGDIHSQDELSLTDVTNQGNLGLNTDQTNLAGQIVNEGTLTVRQNEGSVQVYDEVTLTGGGTLRLRRDSVDPSRFGGVFGGSRDHLINSVHTISGAGVISGLKITNQAGSVIDANVAGSANPSSFNSALQLVPDSRGIVNQGTLRASNGGTLVLGFQNQTAPTKIDNQGGIIEAVEGSLIHAVGENSIPGFPARGGADISGGTLRTRSGGRIGLIGRLSNLKIDGTVHALGDLALNGEIENVGQIITRGFDGSTNTAVVIERDVTLFGGGTIELSGGIIRESRFGQSVLNNVGNTIKGPGQIGDGDLKFINGTNGYVISVDEAPLQFQAEITNLGVFEVGSGSRIEIDGTMTNATLGSIVGNGILQSTETIVNEGRIAPGASVGELQIEASLTFTDSAIFEVEVDATGADLLTVLEGNVNLDGDLQINFLAGYTPSESDVFDILNIAGSGAGRLNGTFAGIGDGDRVMIQDGSGSFVVQYDYNNGRVWLNSFVAAVPEPGSAVFLGMLAIALAGRTRQRRRLKSSH